MTATSSSPPQTAPGANPFDPRAAAPLRPPQAAGVTQDAADPSIGKLVSDASAQMSTLVRSEIELAKLELRSTVKNAGTGIGFFGAAVAILVFSLVFGFLTLAEGLNALGLARWLSFLIVFVFQLLLVGAFAYLGLRKVKKVRAPERTIRTTRETVGYLKSHPK